MTAGQRPGFVRERSSFMKIRTFLCAAFGMAVLMAVPAMADTSIGTVRLDISPEENDAIEPGNMASALEPAAYDSIYYVYDYSTSGTHDTPKKSYTYTIDVRPQNGYAFTDTTAVEVKGASSLSITSRTASRISLTVKTYPFYVLANPKGITEDGDYYRWDKVQYAGKYSVIVYYENEDGEDKETKLSASTNKINLSSYSSGDKSITNISVQAQRGSDEGSNFLGASYYMYEDGTVDDNYTDEDTTFSVPTARSNAIANSTQNSSVTNYIKGNSGGPGQSLGLSGSVSANWSGSGDDWYYIQNGQKVTGWINPINDEWYLMGNDGKMLTGWQLVNGWWYFFNTNHNGTYGRMLTGWWRINRKWYYLNAYKTNNVPYGAMFVNSLTPDHYLVGTDGAWLG